MTHIAFTVIILALIIVIAWQNVAARRERASLIQRIQAPEIAARQFAERPKREPVMAVPIDDDKAYAEAKERRMNGNGD